MNGFSLNVQNDKFPPSRFMGSKTKLLAEIWKVAARFEFEVFVDLFSGSGVVSYLAKSQGKSVFSNDYMAFSANITKALVENSSITLSDESAQAIANMEFEGDGFVSSMFNGLYYTDAENAFIDSARAGIAEIVNPYEQAIAMAALTRACLKKRPRGIFTYTGMRYNDGRRDLKISFADQFLEAVELYNDAVFSNGFNCFSRHGDALEVAPQKDALVYIDPPYYSPLSDNEYVRRYHFVEGLARGWKGVEIQEHTRTKKFKNYPTPFSTRNGTYQAFETLFLKHKESILLVSYSSNSLPTMDEMLELLSRYKRNVEVVPINHRYSFGTHGHKVGKNKNEVFEYLFVGY